MSTMERERAPRVIGPDQVLGARARSKAETARRSAVLILMAAGVLYLLGTLADLALLWGLQRVPAATWEYVAVASTLEGLPRIHLALALIGVALYLRGGNSAATTIVIGAGLILVGLAAAVLGAMIVSDYFIMRVSVGPNERIAFVSTILKALTMSGLQVVLSITVGVLVLRRARG